MKGKAHVPDDQAVSLFNEDIQSCIYIQFL